MAKGDPVVQILDVLPLAASYATPDIRSGTSTPAEKVLVWDFDDGQDEYLDFKCRLHGYAGTTGLTFRLFWSSATTPASKQVRWGLAIRRIADDAEDFDGSHTYVFNEISADEPSAAGEVAYESITFADGPDMDSWADGEIAIVRLWRDYVHADDDLIGDAEFWALVGEET